MAKKENQRPQQSPLDAEKNNAAQERQYREDKKSGKIDEDSEDENKD